MHEDLVKALRTGYCEHKLLNEAADAIEEMQRCIDGIEADNDSLCAKLEELSKQGKSGRWIKPVPGDGEPYCSECKREVPLSGGLFPYPLYTAYCPSCGSEMINGKETMSRRDDT